MVTRKHNPSKQGFDPTLTVSQANKSFTVHIVLCHSYTINNIWGRKEGNVLFNNALTFYLKLYGIKH